MNNELLQEMQGLVAAHSGRDFRPFAYYDKHLDCIRVQLFDCSFTETRLNQVFTVLHGNHEYNKKLAGFNIKGVRHLFEKMGMSLTGVYRMTAVIDALARLYPDSAFETVQKGFRPVLDEERLEVSLA